MASAAPRECGRVDPAPALVALEAICFHSRSILGVTQSARPRIPPRRQVRERRSAHLELWAGSLWVGSWKEALSHLDRGLLISERPIQTPGHGVASNHVQSDARRPLRRCQFFCEDHGLASQPLPAPGLVNSDIPHPPPVRVISVGSDPQLTDTNAVYRNRADHLTRGWLAAGESPCQRGVSIRRCLGQRVARDHTFGDVAGSGPLQP